jgi:hypothetical protein
LLVVAVIEGGASVLGSLVAGGLVRLARRVRELRDALIGLSPSRRGGLGDFSPAWPTLEPLARCAKLRKRLPLGLASLVAAARLRLLEQAGVPTTTEVTGLFPGPLGVLSASVLWLAFSPPRRSLDWVLARAGTEA